MRLSWLEIRSLIFDQRNPSADVEGLADYKRRVRGGEEDDGRCDVLWLCDVHSGVVASVCLRKSLSMIPALYVPSASTMPGLIEFRRILREPSSLPNKRVTAAPAHQWQD